MPKNHIKTIVLTAGLGKRLYPLTKNQPKTLIKISEETILEKIIKNCLTNNLNDFIFIGGYWYKELKKNIDNLSKKYPSIKYKIIYNPDDVTKNNCYSLYLTLQGVKDKTVIINNDVVFDKKIIERLIKIKQTALVVDHQIKLDKESMKIYQKNKNILQINKNLDLKKSYGEYIGIAKIAKKDLFILKQALRKIIKNNSGMFYEDAFALMFKKTNFKICETNKLKWIEIDTMADLAKARQMFG